MQYIIRQFATIEGEQAILRPIYIEAESDAHAVELANNTKLDPEAQSGYLCRPDGQQQPLLCISNYMLWSEAARFAGKCADTIRHWRAGGLLHVVKKIGVCNLYSRSELIDIKRGAKEGFKPRPDRRAQPKNQSGQKAQKGGANGK